MDPWLAVSLAEGYPESPVSALLRPDTDPRDLLRRPPAGLPRAAVARLRSPDLQARIEATERQVEDLGLQLLRAGRDDYPGVLAEVLDRPAVLFLRGSRESIRRRPAVAIVGSRTPTPYGLAATEDFAAALSFAGVTIWSGLARGIDERAHRTALAAGARTVAVLAGGLDEVEPRTHRGLADAIVEHDGALLSEAPPGRRPRRGHFPRRNRILARSVDAVLVIEAGARSGTLHTANHALEAGVEVFALPGPYTSERSRGCHSLLRDGAQLADRPSTLLRELGFSLEPSSGRRSDRGASPLTGEAEPTAEDLESAADLDAILAQLGSGPRPEDSVLRESGLDADRFVSALIRGLEQGRLIRLDGGLIARRIAVRSDDGATSPR